MATQTPWERLMPDWQGNDWVVVAAAALVLIFAPLLVARAMRRAKRVREGLTDEQRDRRGRIIEDALTIAVASVAAGLSLTGLVQWAEHTLGLEGIWRFAPFFGLDAAVIVCAIRARRRATKGEAAGMNGTLVWVLAGISAMFNFGEGVALSGLWGGIGRAVWPLIAATLFELGLLEQRRAAIKREDRRVGWIRWFHPLERIRVHSMLAANTRMSADEATHVVRVQQAARKLHTLRVLKVAAEDASGWRAWWPVSRARRAERTAQRALAFAGFNDPAVAAEVLQRTQALVRTGHFASMDYSSAEDAQTLLARAIEAPSNGRARRPRASTPRAEQPAARTQNTRRNSEARAETSATPRAQGDAYALYVERMDAARARGDYFASDEPSGNEIGEWTGTHPGNGRNVRSRWRKDYAEDRGLPLEGGKPVLNPLGQAELNAAEPERDPIFEQVQADERAATAAVRVAS